MTLNKKPMKVSQEWYDFIVKFGANRVKAGVDIRTGYLCDLSDIIMKYFKENNDKYLEVVNMRIDNGTD